MKKIRIVLPLILGGLLASSLSFVFLSTNNAKSVEAASEFTAATLPTSINLEDCTGPEIKSYYSGLTGKDSAQLQGTNLLKNLKAILSNGVDYYSYADVSKAYVITDRDWTNSPASGISGYSSSTNSISSLNYSTEVSANPYLHLLYCDYSVQLKTKYTGDGDVSSTSVSFDKEHAWSQSHGFDNSTSSGSDLTGAGSDLHHLKAGTQYGNRTLHSNYSYGFVKENDGDWSSKTYETKNKRGEPLFPHSDDQQTKVFEPQDSDKGDIARALLYMVACYNNYDGSTPTPANPALKLVNYVISGTSSKGYSSDNLENGYYGILQDILAWHKMDPVDQYEIHRNNLIYRNYQHNRNPFIDYPEWVDYIWGTSTYDSTNQTISYNSTSTGYVDLDTDVINGYKSSGTVSVTGVSVSPSSQSITNGSTLQLTATISPSNATNKSVSWTSSKTSVATVSSSGLVTANGTGTATITATTADGGFTSTCALTVTAAGVAVTGVSVSPTAATLTVGNTQQLTATVSPSNATNKAVSWSSGDASIASVDSSGLVTANSAGSTTITVTTSDGGFTATCNVTVNSPVVSVTGVSLNTNSLNLSNNEDSQLTTTVSPSNATNKAVTWTSSNDAVATVDNSGLVTATGVGSATITVTTSDGGFTATCNVTVAIPASGTVTINYADTFSPALPTASSGVNTTDTAHTDTTSNFAFKEQNIYKGSSATYMMFYKNTSSNGFLYNTTSLGTITKVSVTYSSNCSTSAYVGVYFGSSVMSTYSSASNKAFAGKSQTDEFTNSTAGYGYFQLSTSNSNVQITNIDVTYESVGSDPVVTSVTVNPSTLNLDLNGTATGNLSANVSGLNNPATTVTWSSNNTSVATVNSSGVVTAHAKGTATITATSTVTSSQKGTCTVTVIDSSVSSPVATLATSLSVGDKVIIAAQTSKTASTTNVMKNENVDSKAYRFKTTEKVVTNQTIEYTTDATVWTVGGSAGAYTFYDGSKYLYGYTTTYSSSTYSNIAIAASPSSGSTWTITANSGNTGFDMYTTVDTNKIYVEWYSGSSSSYFSGWSSSNNDCPINFYKIYSSDDFANDFMSRVSCNANGTSAPTISGTWNNLKSLYDSIWSEDEQNLLKNASFTVSGTGSSTTVTPDSGTTQVVANAMSKYDYIVGKYGTSSYSDFIARNPDPIGSSYLSFVSNDSGSYILVIASTIIAVASIAGFIIIRKKRNSD